MLKISARSSPAKLVDYVCDQNVTTMIWAVSAVCLISAFHGLDYRVPSSVKRILFSGEEMPLKHLENWMAHLPNTEFVNLYGPTEITCNCTFHRVSRDNDYSCGIPIASAFPNERVFLLNEENKLVTKCGEIGEICVSGTALALGYYNNPEATAEVFDKDGFFHTGDYGRLDEEGWIYITGRKKNLIILSNGKNVYPEEIEADLQKVEGVTEVVVYAGESKVQKDKITIVAEIFPDADLLADKGITDPQAYFEEQVKLLNARMPSYKAVKRVKLRDVEFQKNTSRKITRFSIDKNID